MHRSFSWIFKAAESHCSLIPPRSDCFPQPLYGVEFGSSRPTECWSFDTQINKYVLFTQHYQGGRHTCHMTVHYRTDWGLPLCLIPHICRWDHGDHLSVWSSHLSLGSWGLPLCLVLTSVMGIMGITSLVPTSVIGIMF